MTAPAVRRAPRRARPVDVSAFADQVAAALAAFGTDVSYAVSMARAAVVIDRKRRVWQARKDLRDAEAAAHAECATTEAFDCHAVAPCGTGDCKFATGEHAGLHAPAAGDTARPQRANTGGYSLDAAVNTLADQRADQRAERRGADPGRRGR